MPGALTFLKKLGQVLVNVAGIAVGIGPIITPFLGSGKVSGEIKTGINDFTAIGQAVAQIETAFAALPAGTTGPQKASALLPLVANIVKTSELVSGKKIQNEPLFIQACQEVGQGMVDLLNSIHPDEVKTS